MLIKSLKTLFKRKSRIEITDTQRLDWLIENSIELPAIPKFHGSIFQMPYRKISFPFVQRPSFLGSEWCHQSPRVAIDEQIINSIKP